MSPWIGPPLALALGALLASAFPHTWLEWQAEHPLQVWRWFTAAFVHYGPLHLGANLLGCAVVAVFALTARLPAIAAWAWWMAWPLSTLSLTLWPAVHRYGGSSGALHAGAALVAGLLATQRDGAARWIGVGVILGGGAKVLLEAPWVQPIQPAGWVGVPVAVAAHAGGWAVGCVVALAAAFWGRLLRYP